MSLPPRPKSWHNPKRIYYATLTDSAKPPNDPLGYFSQRPKDEETSSILTNYDKWDDINKLYLLDSNAHNLQTFHNQMMIITRNSMAHMIKECARGLGFRPASTKKENLELIRNHVATLCSATSKSRLIETLRTIKQCLKSTGSTNHTFLGFPEPSVASSILRRSAQLSLNLTLPKPYSIISYVSDPILFPLVPADYTGTLSTAANLTVGRKYLALFIKIYNPEKFTSMTDYFPKTVKYRLSTGRKFNDPDFQCYGVTGTHVAEVVVHSSERRNFIFSMLNDMPRPIVQTLFA